MNEQIATETDSEVMDLVAKLGKAAIILARNSGYRDNETLRPDQRAVELLKDGIPLALMDPKFAALLG
jgi:hypothetical protein